VDHIFPQTLFSKAKLVKAGFDEEQIGALRSMAQQIPNLQLLTPAENESKGGSTPETWLTTAFPDDVERDAIRAFHHLGVVSDDMRAFESFVIARRDKLADVIRSRLGLPSMSPDAGSFSGESLEYATKREQT
jgi:hypothetical protein